MVRKLLSNKADPNEAHGEVCQMLALVWQIPYGHLGGIGLCKGEILQLSECANDSHLCCLCSHMFVQMQRTPLMLAAWYGKSFQMLEMLLEANADVNAVNKVRVCGVYQGVGSYCKRDSLVGHGATLN